MSGCSTHELLSRRLTRFHICVNILDQKSIWFLLGTSRVIFGPGPPPHAVPHPDRPSWSYTIPPSVLSCTILYKSFWMSGKLSSTSWRSFQDREKHWQSVRAFTVARYLPLVRMHVSVKHKEPQKRSKWASEHGHRKRNPKVENWVLLSRAA